MSLSVFCLTSLSFQLLTFSFLQHKFQFSAVFAQLSVVLLSDYSCLSLSFQLFNSQSSAASVSVFKYSRRNSCFSSALKRNSYFRDRTLDLEINLESSNKPKMLWTGPTSRKLGLIEPAGSTEITLECVPQDTALQTISGVKLTDTSLKRTYDFDAICHVYVKPKVDSTGEDLVLSQAG